MSTDNRTELNDCEAATGWTGDGQTPYAVSLTGQFYQGANSIGSQHSDADEHMSTTEDSLNTGTFSINMADVTLYLLLKDNLVDTLANGGVQFVVGDGTDKIGYDVGGNDAVGLALNPFFNCYKLDMSNRPAAFTVFAGVEANLTDTAITEVGVGTLHLAKAQGNVSNIFVDYISYIANGSAALTINGGTVGTPETMADVQGDDVTNGWGLVSNPVGSQYQFFGPTEWGDTGTGSSYFTAADEQWYFLGGVVGAGNFDFALVANSTGTNSFVISNTVIVGTSIRSAFDFAPANHNIMQLTSVTFTDIGAITFPLQSATNKFANFCIFNNCAQVDPSTLDMDGATFNGTTDANGALLIAATTANMSNFSFISDGTGHAIYITATGTYDLTNFSYTGYGADGTTDAVVYNNSGGAVTLNVVGGDTPSVRNGASASTTVSNSVTVSVAGVTEGAACKIIANETVGTITTGDVILEALADNTGTASTSLSYEGAFEPSGLDVITRVRSSGLPTGAIADDNGVYTDETTNANKANASTMTLLPATPVVNQDRYIIGHPDQFGQLKIDLATAGTGGFTITWQYWNGAWTALSGVTDGTSSFSNAGLNYVSWTIPGDWATTTINSQGPYYYIRAAYTAGTVTVTPVGTRCSVDVQKYLPFNQAGVVTSAGLTVTASWNKDTIAIF